MNPGKKFCTNCGQPLGEKAKFCAGCGAPVVSTSTEEAVPPPVSQSPPAGTPPPAYQPPPQAPVYQQQPQYPPQQQPYYGQQQAVPGYGYQPPAGPIPGEVVIGIIPNAARKKNIIMSDTFNIVVTNHRMICALLTSDLIKEVAAAHHEVWSFLRL